MPRRRRPRRASLLPAIGPLSKRENRPERGWSAGTIQYPCTAKSQLPTGDGSFARDTRRAFAITAGGSVGTSPHRAAGGPTASCAPPEAPGHRRLARIPLPSLPILRLPRHNGSPRRYGASLDRSGASPPRPGLSPGRQISRPYRQMSPPSRQIVASLLLIDQPGRPIVPPTLPIHAATGQGAFTTRLRQVKTAQMRG